MEQGSIITLTGGSGFVGTHLAYQLKALGYRVRVLGRSGGRDDLAALTGAEYVGADFNSATHLSEALSGSAAVINLIGILNEGTGEQNSFHYAHVVLPDRIMQACRDAGVPVYLHMGALNAGRGKSQYLQSKGEAESRVLAANDDALRTAVVRPSVIFGEGDSFFNRFAGLLKFAPLFPLGCSDAIMAPVCIDDVCSAFIDALGDASTAGQGFDLVGPKDYTLGDLIRYTGEASGHRRPVIGLPDFMARIQATLLGFVPGKPMTMDNYWSLQIPSTSDSPEARQSTSIESRVPDYLKLPMQAQWQQLRANNL